MTLTYVHLHGYCCGGREESLFDFIPSPEARRGHYVTHRGHRWRVEEVFDIVKQRPDWVQEEDDGQEPVGVTDERPTSQNLREGIG